MAARAAALSGSRRPATDATGARHLHGEVTWQRRSRASCNGRSSREVWGTHLAHWFEGARSRRACERSRARRLRAGACPRRQPARHRASRRARRGRAAGATRRCARSRGLRGPRAARHAHRVRAVPRPSVGPLAPTSTSRSAPAAAPRPDGAGGTMAGVMFRHESGERVEPRFLPLEGSTSSGPGAANRPEAMADFPVGHTPLFAQRVQPRVRAAVGRGLVEPLDDHRPGNPPLAAGCLPALVLEVHRTGRHLPELLTFLVTSMAYAAPVADRRSCRLHPQHARRDSPARHVPARRVGRRRPRRAGVAARESTRSRARRCAADRCCTTCCARWHRRSTRPTNWRRTPHERLVELWRLVLSRAHRADEVERFPAGRRPDLAATFRDLAYALLTGREFGHHR